MSEREQYQRSLREIFHNATGVGEYETTIDTASGVEAVAAQVLRDLIERFVSAKPDDPDWLFCQRVKRSIENFADEREITTS